MNKVRNAVIIIILCIIGAYSVKKSPQLYMKLPKLDAVRDAVAGHRARLSVPDEKPLDIEDMFHESGVQPRGTSNTLGDIPPPPRGQGGGGFDPLPQQNTPQLSPSGPSE